MNMSKRLYTRLELPVNAIDPAFDYIPRRTNDPAEEERRQGRPQGMLLAEEQIKGSKIGLYMLRESRSRSTDLFEETKDFVKSALWTSALYVVNHPERMHRNVEMGISGRRNLRDRDTATISAMNLLADASSGRLRVIEPNPSTITPSRLKLGRTLASAAIALTAYEHISEGADVTPDRQDSLRRMMLDNINRSTQSHTELGTTTSLVNIADPYGDAPVHLMRTGSHQIQSLYQEAQDRAGLISVA